MKWFNGDCLEILKDVPDNSVDLVIIDPPYEFDKGGGAILLESCKCCTTILDFWLE